jgi:SAM-dependent methyltransferase
MISNFPSTLQNYLQQLAVYRGQGASEDSIRDLFLSFLRAAFPRLNTLEPIWLEEHVPALRVQGGFADALYGDLIFEFKRHLDESSLRDGQEKLRRYLLNQHHPDRFFGILSDGETLQVYALRDEQLVRVDEIRLNSDRHEESKIWLDVYLFHEKRLVPTANDVALRFGERSPTFWRSMRLLRGLWQREHQDPSVQTKFTEWRSLLSIVYGSTVGDEELFLRHTYLALFARVLAFVALRQQAPPRDDLPGLVTGETFERLGLDNFVTNDFFAWVNSDLSTTCDILSALATRLTGAYDLSAVKEDLLKELYQELVDPDTRHELGEFYTPDWLAELTLRRAGFPSPDLPSLLDPACGSGTFLFIAVRLMREAGVCGSALVDWCAHQMAGIDVHPLAVIIARTNLVLALGDDLRHARDRFSVPVYMADSLSLPQALGASREDTTIVVPVDMDTLSRVVKKERISGLASEFHLPSAMADSPDLLNDAIDHLIEFANPSYSDEDADEGFKTWMIKSLPQTHWMLWRSNFRLMRWLLRPPATDTVWRFILKNAYRPALLARRRFTFVVGNPPWLAYRFIQRRDYQSRVRELVFYYQLLDKADQHLFTQMELATLFFAFCAEHYLADGGTLAFVMPRSILTGAKQHASFRQRFVSTAEELIDTEQVKDLFNTTSCVVIWRKQEKASQKKVRTIHLAGELPIRNASLKIALDHLRKTETFFVPPIATGQSPYLERIVNGASIYPRCLWFVRPPQDVKVLPQQRPPLETDPRVERQAKRPWNSVRLRGSVEADFLFATLLSDNMLPFGWRALSLIVLPLVEHRLLDARAAIREGKTGLAGWLQEAEKAWQTHRKSSEELLDYLNWQKKLTAQRPKGCFKVLYNTSGTHLCSCVVDGSTLDHWRVYNLPVQGFIADTKTYWMETESSDEAHYLCATLNAPVVDEAIKPFQPKGAFGAQIGKGERDIHRRPFEILAIPVFDPHDKRHQRLAELSRECHEKVSAMTDEWIDEAIRSAPIGKLRQIVRTHLSEQVRVINEIVSDILKGS